jgi:hypothetical protein
MQSDWRFFRVETDKSFGRRRGRIGGLDECLAEKERMMRRGDRVSLASDPATEAPGGEDPRQ